MGKESRKKCFASEFDTDLNPHVVAIRNLVMRFPKQEATDSADTSYKTYQPDRAAFGTVEFTGIAHPDSFGDIKGWVKENYEGSGNAVRREITINCRKHQQADAIRTFNLIGAYPIAFNYVNISSGQDGSSVVRWNLTVRTQQIKMS